MKNQKIWTFASAIVSAAALHFAPAALGQAGAEPPVEAPAPLPAIAPSEDINEHEEQRPKKRLRVEKRGPVHRIQVEGHESGEDVLHESTSEDGGRIEKRIVRRVPGGNEDIVIRNFEGPKGPKLAIVTGEQSEHLAEAIKHLHAAGMHAEAERLQMRMDHPGIAKGLFARPDGDVRGELDQLRREQAKLQKDLRKLQKTLANGPGAKPKEETGKPAAE